MKHDWEYKKLGDVATFQRGLTYSSEDEVDISTKCVLRSNNINLENSCLDFSELKYLREDFIIPEDRMFCDNSIFICMSNGSKQHIGKVAYVKEKINYAFGGFMGLIIPDSSVQGKFVYYNLRSSIFKSFLNSIGEGANIKNLRFSDLSQYTIPVPPLPTQQSIVSELDSLSKIIADCKETLKDYDALEQSIFYDMFGDPVKNDKGWEVKKLGEMCDIITKGTTPTTVGFQFLSEGINFVKVESFEEGKLNATKFAYISKECHEALRRSQLCVNDILICIAGATVGKLAIVTEDILPANTNQACCLIRLKKEYGISRDYIFSVLQSDYIKNFIESLKKGVAQPNLTLEHVRNFKIPNVPLPLQQQFASKIEAIEKMKSETKQALQEAETLFQARMDYWFN